MAWWRRRESICTAVGIVAGFLAAHTWHTDGGAQGLALGLWLAVLVVVVGVGLVLSD